MAVVTGAGSGIGRAIALRFAEAGARLVLAELNPAASGQTAALLAARSAEYLDFPTDVGDPSAVARLFAQIDAHGWPVDILVNNAGAAEPALRPVNEVSDERWDLMLRVHLSGSFYCAREALRRMLPLGRGAVINLGSVAGLNGLPGSTAYAAAKGGVIAMTKSLSQEMAPRGIRINCIAPGWIDTPMLDCLPEKWRPGMITHTPLGRLGQPQDIAELALFLAGDESSFITGQIISPNGGMFRW